MRHLLQRSAAELDRMMYTRELPIRRGVSVRAESPRKRRMHSARCKRLLQAFPMLSQSFKIPLKHRWVPSGRRRETEVFLLNISQSFRVKPLASARRKGNARRAVRGRREASSRPKGKRMANKKLLPLQLRSMRIPEGFESACS